MSLEFTTFDAAVREEVEPSVKFWTDRFGFSTGGAAPISQVKIVWLNHRLFESFWNFM